jgi:hypothetical protein
VDTRTELHPLTSPDTCRVWLTELPKADSLSVVNAISTALGDLPGRGRLASLEVLEVLRSRVLAIQDALALRYVDKLLPLNDLQSAALSASTTLSLRLAQACVAAIGPSLVPSSDLHKHAALVHQRAVFWTVQGMIAFWRARHRVPDGFWTLARDTLVSASAHGLAEKPVRDSLRPNRRSCVADTYLRGLLLHLASPRSLSAREFDYTCQIANHFEGKVGMTFRADAGDAADPDEASGKAERSRAKLIHHAGLVHHLDMSALAKSMTGRIGELNAGRAIESPVFTPPATITMLRALFTKLNGAWCGRANMRRFPRRRRSGAIFCAIDPELIYGLMKRRRYSPPPPAKVYSHVEVANIFIDAETISQKDQKFSAESWQQVLGLLDCWELVEESATGLSMQRGIRAGNALVRRGQFAAIRHGAEGTAMVGEIRWAEQTDDGRIEIGVEMLPGLARAGAVRHAGVSAIAQLGGKAAGAAALILDNFKRNRGAGARAANPNAIQTTSLSITMAPGAALPQINSNLADEVSADPARRSYTEQATILLPVGWAREGAVIEFIDGATTFRMTVGAIVSRHGEFERTLFAINP